MKIYTYPDTVLRAIADPVKEIDEGLHVLIRHMAETMYSAPGIGLAANQVGITKRVIIYDLSPKGERNLSIMINPEIVQAEGEIIFEEACLSVIDYSAEVRRNARIQVRGIDQHGNPLDVEAEGLHAICLQHEIDHLNGRLFIDHLSSLKRSLYKKKLKKMQKKG
ncbi:MAG: peptide deformylase [Deltaproteobacteria bacterium]|nr:peptide deformylase [Deltaproteobacteria bacterium]